MSNFKGHNWGICRKCGKKHVSYSRSGKKNPMFGKVFSKEHRWKLGSTWRGKKRPPFSKEHRKNLSLSKMGNKNPMYRIGSKHPMFGKQSAFYGKKHSEEAKRRIGLAQKGKTLSAKTREKISRSCEGKFVGKNNGMYGRFGKNHPGFGHKVSKEHRRKLREKRLHQIFPKKDSKIERKLQKALRMKGLTNFKTHYPILGQPDIAFTREKILIFADGDYWHMLEGRPERDAIVTKTLEGKGWVVLRFWGHEINSNVKKCVSSIESVVNKVSSSSC